eukprot:g5026.t1
MRRNEKLRCSIEALDLQVKLHKQPKQAAAGQPASRAAAPKGPKSAAIRKLDGAFGHEHQPKLDNENVRGVMSSDSYEAEGIPEVLPTDDHFDYSSSEDEAQVDKAEGVRRNDGPVREVQEVLVGTAEAPSVSISSPSASHASSPEPVENSDGESEALSKEDGPTAGTPTWIRTLDPAPTKIFDSLDLSMTVRQSIEVERNRQRVEEDLQQEEEGEQQVTVAFEHRDMTAQQEIGSSANAKLVGSPRSPTSASSPVSKVGSSGEDKNNHELSSLKITSSSALTPGTHDDMKYNSMRTHAPVSPRRIISGGGDSIFEEASKMTVGSTSTTATQATEGGYAFLRQKALERKRRNEERKKTMRLARKRQVMMTGLLTNGDEGSGKAHHQGRSTNLLSANGSKTLNLQKRASWGRDLARMSPRRRARREAAKRRKDYEKMINMQMKEERLQRRRALQRKRKQLQEQESRILMQQLDFHQHQQDVHNSQFNQQVHRPSLPVAQWQNQPYQRHHVAPLPAHGASEPSRIPHHPAIMQDAPPSERRPLGRDYGCAPRSGFRAGIDPRSTISIEEDRLRGSLMRLEHRLEQTRIRKIGSTHQNRSKNVHRGKRGRYAGIDCENMPNNNNSSRPNCISSERDYPEAVSHISSNRGGQQNFMHTEKGDGADILRYPVAQQQHKQLNSQPNRSAGRYAYSNAHSSSSNTATKGMRLPPAPNVPQSNTPHKLQNASTFRVHPPTEVKVIRPSNGSHETEVQLSYSVLPVQTGPTDIGVHHHGGRAPGYFGLREHREMTHMQRMATMRPVSHQQPRAKPMTSGVKNARPHSQQQPRSATMKHRRNTHTKPKGSLHQKPRTRRIVLGKTKMKPSSSKVRTGGLVQVDTDKLHLLLSP